MNTFQLECFLAVASSLNFTKAAKHLNVTQTTITNQIKSLEDELQVKLFMRSTRMVEITPAGREFVTDAKNMITIAKQAKLRFTIPSETQIENISIGCGSYLQLRHLTEILNRMNPEIRNFHPRLQVVQREQLFHLLDTDQVDVIFDVREGCELKGDMKFKEISQSNIVCVCRKNGKFSGDEPITIEKLSEECLIFCDPMTLSPDISRLQQQLVQGRTPSNTHFAMSSESSLILAGAGIGITFLPEIYIPNEMHLQIIRLENAPKFSFGMFYKSSPGDSLIKKFVKTTKEYFAEMEAEKASENAAANSTAQP
ncbi:MAG: LysR family transcriptional regulator [Eubacteriales bacterium]|nr:LysR family transcriptional regulator [Eubacteriales bacterium]MDY4899068.1 LysR family transcriptional regulator [Eubacteriales bacterium]